MIGLLHIFTSAKQGHLHAKGHPKGPTRLKSGKNFGTQVVKLIKKLSVSFIANKMREGSRGCVPETFSLL